MNVKESLQAQYERALERAHDGGYFIAVWVSDDDGNRKWGVTTRERMADPDGAGWYTVRLDVGARVMTCNCKAGQSGVYCKHRALVREALLAERESNNTFREVMQDVREH